MKKFLLGVGATIGAIIIGQKIYDKGYNEAIEDSKEKDVTEKPSKDKKAK